VQVLTETRLLDRAKTELQRLKTLSEIRTARWSAAGQLERSVADWLHSGIPGDCRLVPIDDPPLSELLVPADGVLDRGFGRPLQAIRHGGEEDAAPIRFENLSDYQLETLIKRLERG
jgi:hypothetical protein